MKRIEHMSLWERAYLPEIQRVVMACAAMTKR